MRREAICLMWCCMLGDVSALVLGRECSIQLTRECQMIESTARHQQWDVGALAVAQACDYTHTTISTIRIAHASSTAEQPIRIVVVVATCMILWYVPPVTGSMWSGDVSVCLVLLNAGLSLNLTKVFFSSPRVSQKACGSAGRAAHSSSHDLIVGMLRRPRVARVRAGSVREPVLFASLDFG